MNSSQTISLLKQVKDDTSNILTTNSSLSTANTALTSIKNDSSEINKQNRIAFNAKLTDNTNNYLDRLDYSSSPIIFNWQNDKGVPVFINKYRFTYTESNEPTPSQLYHSTAWDSKIGALNSSGTDFEAPYVTVHDNSSYYSLKNSNAPKQQWVSSSAWLFENDFSDAPIEIGVSRKFGHYIAADLTTTSYDSDPIGRIEGYYYS